MNQQADTLLKDFGAYIGIPDLAFDDDNLCTLSFDDLTACLSFRERSNQLVIYADVGLLPHPPFGRKLLRMMEANCLQPESAALGVKRDEAQNAYIVALSRVVDLPGLEQERFQKILQEFLASQEKWREEIAAAETSEESDEERYQPPSSIRA